MSWLGRFKEWSRLQFCVVRLIALNYFGMPLGSSYKATTMGIKVIERMERLLVGWEKLYVQREGD